jgi:peptidoglycan DL-endopeptidase CwlO
VPGPGAPGLATGRRHPPRSGVAADAPRRYRDGPAALRQFGLGSDGWAYLAALNYAESSFGADNGPGTGVLSASNYAGAAGPMQIGIGGAATDNWSTIIGQIPPNLPGATQPPSVYNETDAVYGAALLLKRLGAPGN